MPAEPLIDLDRLTAPIPGEAPAGGPVSFAAREALDEARKEIDPANFDPEDLARPTEVQRADWNGIVRMTQEILSGKSKDLLVAARLTEALTKIHGFAGLGEGLNLMQALVAHCWDRLYPPIEEDGDVERRAAAFVWLDDPARGARFPTTVRQVPLVSGPDGPIAWLDWKRAQAAKDESAQETFEQAIRATPTPRCRQQVEDLAACLRALDALEPVLNEAMDEHAPGVAGLRQAVTDCHLLAQQILSKKPAEIPAPSEEEAAGPEAPGAERAESQPALARAAGPNRAQLYGQVAAAAAALKQIEPHSPIPYLLERAVQLGALPFPELMKVLIRNDDVLKALNREFGLQDGAGGDDGDED